MKASFGSRFAGRFPNIKLIVNCAVPQVSFTEFEYTVYEDEGQVTVCAEVTNLNCSEVEIWLTFETEDGSALGNQVIS